MAPFSAAWERDPVQAKRDRTKPPTKQERGELADLQVGRQRKADIQKYLSVLIRRRLVGTSQPENRFGEALSPVVALEDGEVVRFETTSHLRKSDIDREEEGWAINY